MVLMLSLYKIMENKSFFNNNLKALNLTHQKKTKKLMFLEQQNKNLNKQENTMHWIPTLSK